MFSAPIAVFSCCFGRLLSRCSDRPARQDFLSGDPIANIWAIEHLGLEVLHALLNMQLDLNCHSASCELEGARCASAL